MFSFIDFDFFFFQDTPPRGSPYMSHSSMMPPPPGYVNVDLPPPPTSQPLPPMNQPMIPMGGYYYGHHQPIPMPTNPNVLPPPGYSHPAPSMPHPSQDYHLHHKPSGRPYHRAGFY